MRTTYDLTRFPERTLEMIPALLTALIIGGAGGYFVKNLSTSGPPTINAPASVAPAIPSSSGDAMDRALAKLHASPVAP